ncbi:MAG: hypothetical protein ACI81R_001543 [Bradymonadia bacterium]
MTSPSNNDPSTAPPQLDADAMAWFNGGAPVPDDFVDQALATDEPEEKLARNAVIVLVMLFAAFLAYQYVGELAYSFSETEAVDLNVGSDDEMLVNLDVLAAVTSNRHVSVVGIRERRSFGEERTFHKLVGSQIYVEEVVEDDRPRILRNMPMPVERGEQSFRPSYENNGRLIAFKDLPKRYEGLIAFYSNNYRTWFCGYEPSTELADWYQRLENQTRFDLQQANGTTPSAEEVAAALDGATTCQNASLMLDGRDPASYRQFWAIYAALAFVFFGGAWMLSRNLLGRSKE